MSGRRSCNGSVALSLRAPSPSNRRGLPGAAGELALDRLTGEVRPCAGAQHPRDARRVQAPGRIGRSPLCLGVALPSAAKGLMSAGTVGVAHRRNALDRGGPWIVDDEILEGHDAQLTPNHVEQLSRSEKELRPCRSAKTLVSDRERLVQQRTWGGDRRDQLIQEGPEQVVRDHHPRKRRSPSGNRSPLSRSISTTSSRSCSRTSSSPETSRSTATTSCPWSKNQRVWRPAPLATSSTGPGAGIRDAKRVTQDDA